MNSSRAKSSTENRMKEERLSERKAKLRGLKRTKAITKKDKSKDNSNNRNSRSSSSKKTYKREFEVEKILDRGMYKGKVHFLIKWKGYSKNQCTWEPRAYLGNAPKKIRLFEKKLEGQPIRELKSLAFRGRSKSKTERKKRGEDSYSPLSSSDEGSVSSSEEGSVASTTSRKARKESATPNTKNKSTAKKEKKSRKTKSSVKSEALLADIQQTIDAQKQPQSILSKRSSSKVIDSNNQDSASWFNLVKKTKMNSGIEEIKVSQAGSKSPIESESDDDFGEAIDYRNKEAESQAQVYDMGLFSARNNNGVTKQKSSFVEEEHPPAQEISPPNEKLSTPIKNCVSLPHTQSSSESKLRTPDDLNKNTHHESEIISNKDSVIRTLNIQSDQQDLENKDVPRSRLDTIQTEFDTKIEGSFQSLTTVDSHLPSTTNNENSMEELNEDERKKQQITLGSFTEGDIPVRVLAAKPIPEAEDLELLILWRRRLSGVQPEKSKIMRLEFLEKGYHMLLVEYYERKMSLASISSFNPKNLPKHHSTNNNNQLF